MKELWSLLVSAQENIGGIPSTFLEKKKEEIKQRKVCITRMFDVSYSNKGKLKSNWFENFLSKNKFKPQQESCYTYC